MSICFLAALPASMEEFSCTHRGKERKKYQGSVETANSRTGTAYPLSWLFVGGSRYRMSGPGELRLPGCFPSAPKACRSAAEPFFACFSEKAKKQSPSDTEAGERCPCTARLRNLRQCCREERSLSLSAGDAGLRNLYEQTRRESRNQALPGESRYPSR